MAAAGPMQVERFAPKDDDELDARACRGGFDRIVYPDLESLLEAVWKGDASLRRWRELGITLALAAPPGNSPDGDWQAFLVRTCASLERWRAGERRRQVIAGTILSLLALAATAVLLWLG